MTINLCSWNVNGLRAVCKKGFIEWLEKGVEGRPWHLVNLQETKLKEDQLPAAITEHTDFEIHLSEAERPGYSGVATLIHKDFNVTEVVEGTGIEDFDREGRTLTVHTPKFTLINAYYPNGQRDHGRVPYKLEFSEEILQTALKHKKNRKGPVILAGDFNTAHTAIDLKNPKTNQKTTGFLPHERAWLDRLIEKGFVDVFRQQHPEEEGHYTWWTYRNNCREKNVGWRIDYFFINREDLSSVDEAKILSDVHGSDHCPISLQLNL